MSEPQRLSDSGSLEERSLLAAARTVRATPASRQRALVSLGVVSALTLVTATAGAAVKWLKLAGISGWRLLGTQWGAGLVITSVAAGAVTVHVAQRAVERSSADIATPKVSSPSPARTANPKPLPSSAPAATGSFGELAATPPPVSPTVATVATSPAPPSSVAALSAVPTELSLIDTARQRLRTGNGAEALATLNEHRRLYASGALGLEAKVLRIEALEASGNRAQALREAQDFLARYPNSLLSHRVRRWLVGRGAP